MPAPSPSSTPPAPGAPPAPSAAAAIAERDEPGWRRWLASTFPAA
ncbi:hypothetical protein [Parafrankia sp. EAN1pec]